MAKQTVKDIDLKGKRVLMRVDFNVPLDDKLNITDDTRIKAALPTIKYILEKGAKLILMSHLGRPKGKVVDSMRMDPVTKRLEELLGKKVIKLDDCVGEEVKKTAEGMKEGDVLLLENLRFHPEEEKNDPEFCKKLASLGDIYVNDAFGTAHRAHASTEGVARLLPAAAGFLIEKEIEYLGKILQNPERPFVALLGGAKVSDKIPVVENLMDKVDAILIGGGMAYTFLKAQGKNIGSSKLEEDRIDTAKDILQKAHSKGVRIHLPHDHVIAERLAEDAQTKVCETDIPEGWLGVDIGPKTIQEFKRVLKRAKTILWNGPVGVFEMEPFSNGTKEIALDIANLNSVSVLGGGDTAAAAANFDVADKMTHISTGGGASLEFLEGKELPGIAALADK